MRPISKLTRIKVLAEDALGYKAGDFNYKILKKLLKELNIKKYTCHSYVGGTQYHLSARARLSLIVGKWCIDAGDLQIIITYKDTGTGFIVTNKVKIHKLIELIKKRVKYDCLTKKYWFNYSF